MQQSPQTIQILQSQHKRSTDLEHLEVIIYHTTNQIIIIVNSYHVGLIQMDKCFHFVLVTFIAFLDEVSSRKLCIIVL